MANDIIKETARERGVHLWRVAERMGIADSNFSRRLRHELPDEVKARILAIIDELAQT